MRRGRPAPLNSGLLSQEELERDAMRANARNIHISTDNSGQPQQFSLSLPNKAQTANPGWISPTSTLPPGMNYRGDDMVMIWGNITVILPKSNLNIIRILIILFIHLNQVVMKYQHRVKWI